MPKVFEFNSKGNGSFINSIDQSVGTPSGGWSFFRSEKGLAWLGNGSDSKLDTSLTHADLDLTGDKTLVVWFNPYSLGETNYGMLLDNSRFYLSFWGSLKFAITSDNVNFKYSAVNSIKLNKWQMVVITRTSTGIINFYIDNVLSGPANQVGGTPVAGTTNLTVGNNNGTTRTWDGLIAKEEIYDEIFTANQRAKAYNDFLMASPKITEKYPKFMPEYKNSDLSKEIGIAASYNFINTGGLYVDTSGEGFNITINGGISTLAGAKLSAAKTIGNLGNIKTIEFRIKPDSTTEKLMEGAANDKLIHINAGTLTYPEFDNGYVNGVDTDTMVADKWQDVVIISSTNVDFSACSLALNNTTAGNFEIEDLRFFTDEKSSQWIINRYNEYGKKVVLADDLRWDAVGGVLPSGIKIESGTFSVAEDSTGKYILCGTNGSISYTGIDLSPYIGNGWVKKLTGDLSGDEGGTVDAAANLSYTSGKLTIAMTSTQKLRDIYITRGEEL